VFGPSHWKHIRICENCGKFGGKIGEGIIGFWPLTNWILVFRPQTTVQSFIKFDSKLRPQERWQTDRQTPAIVLSVPCYAIAMGQIIMQMDKREWQTDTHNTLNTTTKSDSMASCLLPLLSVDIANSATRTIYHHFSSSKLTVPPVAAAAAAAVGLYSIITSWTEWRVWWGVESFTFLRCWLDHKFLVKPPKRLHFNQAEAVQYLHSTHLPVRLSVLDSYQDRCTRDWCPWPIRNQTVPPCAEWRGETDNRTNTPFSYCPSTASLPFRSHCANVRRNNAKKILTASP